jgi:hypothetical protein
MSSILKPLAATWIFLILTDAAPVQAAPQGFMEGHLTIVPPGVVEPDNMPRPQISPQSYSEYHLIVWSQDRKKEIAQITTDANGNYRVALPPGVYILDVEHRVGRRIGAKPQEFKVASNETVRVDMNIIPGPSLRTRASGVSTASDQWPTNCALL